MGFIFTVAYIVLTIISPEQFGPDWASYHMLLYLAAITALTSLPSILSQSQLVSSIQTYLLLGFIVAIGASQVANRWFGGAIQGWLEFLPSAAVYFFIVANVTSIRRLKIITLAAVASILVLVGEALCGYYSGFLGDTFVLRMNYERGQVVEQILRLRGVGFLNDPNDLAQMLLIALPLIFIAWRQRRFIANSFFILLPAAVLLWATYLTHSRGALIGLAAMCLMAARKKLGTIPSLAVALVLAVGMLAVDFTGGRGISASEGADRMTLWATGLELFKRAPIFGVGFGNFTNFADHTAHNSFILPLAELGLLGSTLWIALLVSTTMDLNRMIALGEESAVTDRKGNAETISDSACDADQTAFRDQTIDAGGDEPPGEHDLVEVARKEEQSFSASAESERHYAVEEPLPTSAGWFPTEEIASAHNVDGIEAKSAQERVVPGNWLGVIRLALISFMTTSWFLSRTYDTPTYLVLGLATAAIALDRPATETGGHGRWIPVTFVVEVLAVIFVYFVVRFRH
jgi:putative inorganic carbon (hco3(-)) transporter